MIMCSKCHQRVAVVFVTKVENNKKTSEGLCLRCAKELGLPIDQMMGGALGKMGMSADQLADMEDEVNQMIANGVKYYIEVANMPTTNEALYHLMAVPGMIVAPSKAVNAGGVSVSGLEMSQNSERLAWSAEEVDKQLHTIMKNILFVKVYFLY